MSTPEPLDPILASALEQMKAVPERDPAAAARSRRRFLSEARKLAAAPPKPNTATWPARLRQRFGTDHRHKSPLAGRRFAFPAMLLLAVALLLGGTAVTASAAQHALPGDGLYPVKTSGEAARLLITFDNLDETQLHLLFAERRLAEMDALMRADRHQDASIAVRQFETHVIRAAQSLARYSGGETQQTTALAEQIRASIADHDALLASFDAARPSGSDVTVRSVWPSTAVAHPMEIVLVGEVTVIRGDSWEIGEFAFRVEEDTDLQPGIRAGDIVRLHASIGVNGDLIAREIERAEIHEMDADPGDEIEFEGLVLSAEGQVWEIDGRRVRVTPDTEIRDRIEAGDFVRVEAYFDSADDLTAIAIELSEHDGEKRFQVAFVGRVQAIGADSWQIAGRSVRVTVDSEIDADIQIGDLVKVRAIVEGENGLAALLIERLDQDGDQAEDGEDEPVDAGDDGEDDDEGDGGGDGDDEDEDDEDDDDDDEDEDDEDDEDEDDED